MWPTGTLGLYLVIDHLTPTVAQEAQLLELSPPGHAENEQ